MGHGAKTVGDANAIVKTLRAAKALAARNKALKAKIAKAARDKAAAAKALAARNEALKAKIAKEAAAAKAASTKAVAVGSACKCHPKWPCLASNGKCSGTGRAATSTTNTASYCWRFKEDFCKNGKIVPRQ